MAISFVGGDSGNGSTAVTLNLPGGIAQNDVVIAAHMGSLTSNRDMDISGYQELADLYQDDTTDTNLGVFRKVMGATPDSTVAFADQGVNACVFHCWRGVNTTTPEDATTTVGGAIDGATPDPPAINTATANAVVLAIGASSEADAVTNAPSGYGNLFDSQGNSANCAISSKSVASPTTEDPATYGDIVGTTADSWAAATVALRPAANAYTLAAASGSYALTGSAATLKATRLLPAASGAYALSGSAANLSRGFTMAAASGAYALTGSDAGLRATRTMAAASGAYALTGSDAALLSARRLAAESGAYSLDGANAALTLGGSPAGGGQRPFILLPLGIGRMTAQLSDQFIWKSKHRRPS